MKKSFHPQLSLVLITLFVSLVGVILRWQQIQKELLPDGGLASGSFLHYILLALLGIFVLSLIFLLRPLPKKTKAEQVFGTSPLANGLLLACAAGLAVGNVILWINGRQATTFLATQSPVVSNALFFLLPPLGILASLCLAGFAIACALKKYPSPLLYMTVSLYLVLRLIVSFQEWNTDPSVYDYGFQLLAAICTMLATFQLAGFSFDKGRLRVTLFWCLSSVVFCTISIADTVIKGTIDSTLINVSLLLVMAVSSVQLLVPGKSAPAQETPEISD